MVSRWGWFDAEPKYYKGWRDDYEEHIMKMVRSFAITPTPCSCDMCGHRRKVLGVTIQERRLHDAEDYEESEVLVA